MSFIKVTINTKNGVIDTGLEKNEVLRAFSKISIIIFLDA